MKQDYRIKEVEVYLKNNSNPQKYYYPQKLLSSTPATLWRRILKKGPPVIEVWGVYYSDLKPEYAWKPEGKLPLLAEKIIGFESKTDAEKWLIDKKKIEEARFNKQVAEYIKNISGHLPGNISYPTMS